MDESTPLPTQRAADPVGGPVESPVCGPDGAPVGGPVGGPQADPVAAAVGGTPAAASGGQRPDGRRPGWWIAPAYLVMAAVLVPWIAVLVQTLPDRVVSANYRLAWVGFDVLLAASLIRTAWLAYKRSPFLVNVASVTAALLVVDAWFDVTTSPRGRPLFEALAAALLVELPLAVLSMVLAYRAQLEIARTGAVRRHRWESWEAWERWERRERRRARGVREPVPGGPADAAQPGPKER